MSNDNQEEDEPAVEFKLLSVNKPGDTAFKQQRLSAWKPVFTVHSMMPVFLVLGVVFLGVGGLLYGLVAAVNEKEIDYTQCVSEEYPGQTCAQIRSNLTLLALPCTCRLNFTLSKRWNGPVYLYYKLTNFYQNHRRYIDSRSDDQLRGAVNNTDSCSPITRRGVEQPDNSSVTLAVAPCGLIANSLFNDSLSILAGGTGNAVNLTATGIAWNSDKNTKFRNPVGNLTEIFSHVATPPNWQRGAAQLDPADPSNNAFQNEDLIVWMRTAALSTFRKLYRRIPQGLDEGDYQLVVQYHFPVTNFEGKKLMVLSTISWFGGRNLFLGTAYLVVGSLSVVIGLVFLFLDKFYQTGVMHAHQDVL